MDAQSSPRDSFASIVANSAQRSYPRQKIHPLVYVNLDQGNGGIVRDLSERGVALQAVARLRVQQQVYLRFELFQPRTRVEAMGQVIWANASGQAGVQFTQISQRTRRLLKEWLLFNLLATADQISSASSIFNDAKRSSELMVSAETARSATPPTQDSPRTDKLAGGEVFKFAWWPVPISPPAGVLNLAMVQRAAASYASRGGSGKKGFAVGSLGRLAIISVIAFGCAVFFRPAGIGAIVGVAVLVFLVVFLSVSQALPAWPVITGIAVFVTCTFFFVYKVLFACYCEGTLGAHLAGIVALESRNDLRKDEEQRFR